MNTRAAPPDWSKVHCPVTCARCGHGLFGQDDPACPACKFEFDWSEAVPLDKLKCSQCTYPLMGLTSDRCPECGQSFTWQEALAALRRREAPLFEYCWREAFVRSWFTSLWWALRPHRLWRRLSVRDTPPMAPLFVMVIVSILAVFTLTSLFVICRWSFSSWMRGIIVPKYWAQILSRSISDGAEIALSAGMWEFFVLILMLSHGQLIQQASLRKAHIVRIWTYSVCMYGNLCFAFISILVESINAMPHLFGFSDDAQNVVAITVFVFAALILLMVPFGMHRGFRLYLKVSYSWPIVLVTLFLSFVLFVAIVRLVDRL